VVSHSALFGRTEQQGSRRGVLNSDAHGLVQGQLRVVRSTHGGARHELTNLGMHLFRCEETSLYRQAEFNRT
jgi:hypothetical protein